MTCVDGVVLLGWMSREDAVKLLREQCIFDPPLNEKHAEEMWRKYRCRVDQLEPRAALAPAKVPITDRHGRVTFRWKDYAHGNKKRKMTLTAEEVLRRFLLHVLPRGFVRIRHFGFLAAPRRRESIAVCRQILAQATQPPSLQRKATSPSRDTWPCPCCGGAMIIVEKLTAQQIRSRAAEWTSMNTS